MIRKIAVIGATGMIGMPVTRGLSRAGFEVTALVRNEPKAKAALPATVRLVRGDIRNGHDLEKLFAGQHAVYLNLNLNLSDGKNAWHSEREGLNMILAAATKAGVKRIAFISSLVKNYQGMDGFHWWVFDMKQQAVERIKASGIPYTIFYPSTFMENFEKTYRRGNRILLAGTSLHKMYFIAGEDFGQQVARAFQIAESENKAYVVQGPEGFTTDEAAAVFVRHYRKSKLTIARAPLGLLKFLGNFSTSVNYGHHIIHALNTYPERFEAADTWAALGQPATTLQAYATRAGQL